MHSRFGPAAPLDGGSIFDVLDSSASQAVKFRPDLRVPLVTIITETDLFGGPRQGYYSARQPDSQQLRVWEIAGTAHADNYTILVAPIDTGSAALTDIVAAYAPTNMLMGQQLDHFINFAPQHHYVLQAALSQLCQWVRTGQPTTSAAPIELSDAEPPQPIVDANGLARGGVRTPWADVPIARTSGVGTEESTMSSIFGSGEPFETPPCAGSTPAGLRAIWNASQRRWTRRSSQGSSWPPIARKFSSSPPRLSRRQRLTPRSDAANHNGVASRVKLNKK